MCTSFFSADISTLLKPNIKQQEHKLNKLIKMNKNEQKKKRRKEEVQKGTRKTRIVFFVHDLRCNCLVLLYSLYLPLFFLINMRYTTVFKTNI